MSSVVRKEKDTEDILDDIGCPMSIINNFLRWWQVASLLWLITPYGFTLQSAQRSKPSISYIVTTTLASI